MEEAWGGVGVGWKKKISKGRGDLETSCYNSRSFLLPWIYLSGSEGFVTGFVMKVSLQIKSVTNFVTQI